MPTLFQVGTVSGLLQGIYDGTIDFKTLEQHGDIGLGTFNGVDGEMIAVDGKFYRADESGQVTLADPNSFTPFATVTKFKPSIAFTLDNINSIEELNNKIDEVISSKNIFHMIRVDGDIEWIKLRSEGCQSKPYKSLADTLPNTQHIFELSHTRGTLVTTRCPHYSSGITITGYHHHFINVYKTLGGHVFDVKIKSAKVMVTEIRRFSMVLVNSKAFDSADLNINTEDALKKTE
jgi:acetolactate decarboxylase